MGFYAQRNVLHVQNLDDAFSAYVWSLLVQQSTVIIGILPEEITSEVWIAPQVSAKGKTTPRSNEQSDSTTPPRLEAIPERKDTSLDVLKEKYGSSLRIAAQPNVIFAAVTGSHLRVCFSVIVPYSNILIDSVVIKAEPYGLQCFADNHTRKRRWCVRRGFGETVRI